MCPTLVVCYLGACTSVVYGASGCIFYLHRGCIEIGLEFSVLISPVTLLGLQSDSTQVEEMKVGVWVVLFNLVLLSGCGFHYSLT